VHRCFLYTDRDDSDGKPAGGLEEIKRRNKTSNVTSCRRAASTVQVQRPESTCSSATIDKPRSWHSGCRSLQGDVSLAADRCLLHHLTSDAEASLSPNQFSHCIPPCRKVLSVLRARFSIILLFRHEKVTSLPRSLSTQMTSQSRIHAQTRTDDEPITYPRSNTDILVGSF
jgi:hypothetical protein